MGDIWSGTTKYDRNSRDRNAESDARTAQMEDERQKRLNSIFSSDTPQLSISGSAAEQDGRMEGLERAKMLTGQDPRQIGQDFQAAYGNIKKRANQSDTGSELLRASKAGAVASARNQMQSQGVKGGAALGAASAIERAKSYDVNNQLMDAQRQAQNDYMNAAKSNANFTQASEMNYGAMAAGKDFKAPSQNSGGYNTVICTELFQQGFYDLETYILDQEYGVKMLTEQPHIYYGYRFWADPVVKLMQKSKLFTHMVAFFALPWAENMAGKKNLFGKFLSVVGEFGCGIIGNLITWRRAYAN